MDSFEWMVEVEVEVEVRVEVVLDRWGIWCGV